MIICLVLLSEDEFHYDAKGQRDMKVVFICVLRLGISIVKKITINWLTIEASNYVIIHSPLAA